ncbi:hypothetical protein HK103_005196 [Boothiomyces macroporosus]|uniref:DNA replication regulator Sld3 C-terminal domain-containing protein n=1 Tax=Boothiomyces macroporosus TaxID=261099 RepID=A0AAD5UFK7_9FUNG|nr:hypothetical protein HK103_005196 [Boothiomyces macroporosus]
MEVLKTPTKTPVKPIELGSPQSSLKPIPHLVFLIDPKSIDVKVIVVRILLLFYIHINPLFTWGYEIINFEKELRGKKLGVAKHDFGFTHAALQQLASDLDIAQSNKQENIAYLIELIRQVSIQGQWNNSIASHLQSPLKRQSKVSKSTKIRNYLFVIAPLPKDILDLNSFLNQKDLQLDELMQVLHQELLSIDLWNDLISERISLHWINSDLPTTNDIVVRTESWLSNILRLYGGRYFDYYLVYSDHLRHHWKEILKIPILDGQISQVYFKQGNYALFMESFDKIYFNFGTVKHPIIKSATIELPETIFPFTCNITMNIISNPQLIVSDLKDLKVIGWTPTNTEFLKSGYITANCTDKLTDCLMGMFSLKESKVKQTPQKPTKAVVEKAPKLDNQAVLPKINTLDEYYETFQHYYSCILYEKFDLHYFLSELIPQFYEKLVELVEPKNMQPPIVILEFFTAKLIKSVSELDAQSKKRVDELSFLYSKANSEMPFKLQTLAQSWFLKQKQKFPPKSDLKIVLKKSLKDLSITEISKETEIAIPAITLHKTLKKSKKLDMKDLFEKLVEDILDRIMISSISLDSDAENLCESLKIKSGGNLEVNEDPFGFPPIAQKPKKRRVKEPKPVMVVQKAPSKLSQMRRQVVSTKKVKSKTDVRSTSKVVSVDDFRKPLNSSNVLTSPIATKTVYIPETPTKPRSIDFLQSPSKRSKRNFEEILATPNK